MTSAVRLTALRFLRVQGAQSGFTEPNRVSDGGRREAEIGMTSAVRLTALRFLRVREPNPGQEAQSRKRWGPPGKMKNPAGSVPPAGSLSLGLLRAGRPALRRG